MFNMKKFRPVILVFAILIFISTNVNVFAVSNSAEDSYEPAGTNPSFSSQFFYDCLSDSYGNMYSTCIWSSFPAARAYYGYDRTYSRCSVNFAGRNYNYFFSFSDSTKCFFKVGK